MGIEQSCKKITNKKLQFIHIKQILYLKNYVFPSELRLRGEVFSMSIKMETSLKIFLKRIQQLESILQWKK